MNKNHHHKTNPDFKSLLSMAHVVENLLEEQAKGILKLLRRLNETGTAETTLLRMVEHANSIKEFTGTFFYNKNTNQFYYE